MKKVSLLLASALLLAAFTGCSSDGGGTTTGGSTSGGSSSGSSSSSSSSSDYPSRSISWYSPSEAGSLSDSLSRDLSELLDLNGQNILVQNLVGGSQSVMLTQLSQEKADGYTMGNAGTSGLLTQPIQQNVAYTLDDFRFVASLQDTWSPVILATPSSGYTSWEDVVEAANGGTEIIYSTGITGNSSHLAIIEMMNESGINLKYVPYSGTTEVDAALEGNHIHIAIVPDSGANRAKFESGQMVPLVHFQKDGIEGFPEVPSASEYGVNFENYINYDIMVMPKDTPDEIYDYVKEQVDALLQTEEYITRKQTMGNSGNIEIFTEEELGEILYSAYDTFLEISEGAGLINK